MKEAYDRLKFLQAELEILKKQYDDVAADASTYNAGQGRKDNGKGIFNKQFWREMRYRMRLKRAIKKLQTEISDTMECLQKLRNRQRQIYTQSGIEKERR